MSKIDMRRDIDVGRSRLVKSRIAIAAIALFALSSPAQAGLLTRWFGAPNQLVEINCKLKGRILDYTFNHGKDNRIYSPALDEKRDMYVYLPPGYDPHLSYPLLFLLHGIGLDEAAFLKGVDLFDDAMACGTMPSMIIVAPDGSLRGKPTLLNGGSFYVNSRAGRFEDYVMQDVWCFMHTHFAIRPERDAHVMAGASMGGFGAYNLSIKYRDRIGLVIGIFPPLNLRYLDCHGRYFGKFDPSCLGWRTIYQPFHPVARFAHGLITIRERRLIKPLYGRDRHAMDRIAAENPVEMLDTYCVKPGELQMFVAYVGHDAFNIDSQVESFLYIARSKGFTVSSVYDPEGKHNIASARKLLPSVIAWLAPRVQPYSPAFIDH
jgi:S-formylglutathione hydrolase FrmB